MPQLRHWGYKERIGGTIAAVALIHERRFRGVNDQSGLVRLRKSASAAANQRQGPKVDSGLSWSQISLMRQPWRYYFFLPEPKAGCQPPLFWLGAAAIVLIFSFLGFLASRLPFWLPLAMLISF